MEGILASVNIHFDFPASEGPQKLLHNQFIPRCLAVHHSLGIGGPDGMQTVSSKAAWMLISLRQAAWALHIGFSSIQATDVEAPGKLFKPHKLMTFRFRGTAAMSPSLFENVG